MNTSTISTIRQILEMDETIPQSDRNKVMETLAKASRKLVEIIPFNEAARRLNVSRSNIELLIRQGYLLKVRGAGNRSLGIRSDSLEQYCQPRIKKNGITIPIYTYEQLKGAKNNERAN